MEMQIENLNHALTSSNEHREAILTFPERRKYLVVEDDFALQPVWEHIIKKIDPHALVRWARTEEGAEQLIAQRKNLKDQFDFVIADILLAGQKNGVDLWKEYKDDGLMFLFTSSMSEEKFLKLVGENTDESLFFLRKPLYIPHVIDCLNALIAYKKIDNF